MMERLELVRTLSDDQGTSGVLVGADRLYHTLELPWRDNQRKVSCIPAGIYQCAIVKSPRFGRIYSVLDVPGRSHILIHSGNFAGDKALGFDSHVEGCILLGRLGALRNTHERMQRAVVVSKATLGKFMSAMGGRPFLLEVKDVDVSAVSV
jgi:hypothetical protein